MPAMSNASELRKIKILSHLSDSDLEKLIAVAEKRRFALGEIIFEEGIEQDSLFIVLSGRVLISKATQSGDQKSITTLGPGSFFGEMALFDDFVRSATVSASVEVSTLEISKDAFMQFLSSDAAGASSLMLEIMRTIAPRIRQTNDELVALYEAGRVIGRSAELGKILSELLAILGDATSCARGAVFLLNTPAQMLECRAAFGCDEDPSGWCEPLEGGVAEAIIAAEEAVGIENFEQDPRFDSLQRVGYETASMLGAALRSQGEAIGTIVLGDKIDSDGNPCAFTPGDANLLAGIAAQASGAIESARLHEEALEREKLDRVYFRH
jgi:CRP-like cAMP-binding protein